MRKGGSQGKVSFTPGEQDVPISDEIQKALVDIKEDILSLQSPKKPTIFGKRAFNLDSNNNGRPMNDNQLKHAMRSDDMSDENTEENVIELRKRVSELEDSQVEFKGYNTWDVPITPLPSTATLEDVIKKLNVVIQRSQRQSRIK